MSGRDFMDLTLEDEVKFIGPKVNGEIWRKDTTVELANGSFLFIKDISMKDGQITLRGWPIHRVEKLNGKVAHEINEVYIDLHRVQDDRRHILQQSKIDVTADQVVKVRDLILTNKSFPEGSYKDGNHANRFTNKRDIVHNGPLVCRWKFIRIFESAYERLRIERNKTHFVSYQLVSFTEIECTRGHGLSAEQLRFMWRGETIPGGASILHPGKGKTEGRNFSHVDLNHEDGSSPNSRSRRASKPAAHEKLKRMLAELARRRGVSVEQMVQLQEYSFGDVCCAGGGMTRGAQQAGLYIEYGIDFAEGETWKCNFQRAGADYHEMSLDQWVHIAQAYSLDLKVDILHLSPPCQPYSLAHTRPGRNDDMNTATLFGVGECIKKGKPRIVTLEETSGIITKGESQEYFNRLIQQITSLGFSVSWQLVKMQDYGVPQRRTRLVIIAACPGETLPNLPQATHSEHGGGRDLLKPWTDARTMLRNIPHNAANHDLAAATSGTATRYPPWPASRKLINCIVTGGSQGEGHPNGGRRFTERELAALQTFPLEHIFMGLTATEVRREIGNAVPPLFAKVLFTAVKKHLQRVDGVRDTFVLDR